MSKWGKRIEFSKGEIQALLNASSKQLADQLIRNANGADPNLISVVKKASKALVNLNGLEGKEELDATKRL